MGRRSKQAFLQRRHTDGQNAYEKMLNVTNYQKSANQKCSEVSPYISQNGHHQGIYTWKGMATHSSILAWEIPWTEEPDRLHSVG